MGAVGQPVRVATVLVCAVAFGLVVDLSTDGPVGLGVLLATLVASVGLVLVPGRHRRRSCSSPWGSWSSPSPWSGPARCSSGSTSHREWGCSHSRAHSLAKGTPCGPASVPTWHRSLAWVASIRPALGVVASPVTWLRPVGGRLLPVVPRALLFSVPVGVAFALLLASADAVFAQLLRSPFERVPFPDLPRHLAVVGAAGMRVRDDRHSRPSPGPAGEGDPADRRRWSPARRSAVAPRHRRRRLRPVRRRAGVHILRRTTLRPRTHGSCRSPAMLGRASRRWSPPRPSRAR